VRVSLAAPAAPAVVARLAALGAEFEDGRSDSFVYAGGGGEPQAALALLGAFAEAGELAIDAITRDRANLSHVFEQVVAGGRAAGDGREVVSWRA
jgi:hypothetical protein